MKKHKKSVVVQEDNDDKDLDDEEDTDADGGRATHSLVEFDEHAAELHIIDDSICVCIPDGVVIAVEQRPRTRVQPPAPGPLETPARVPVVIPIRTANRPAM